MVGLEMDGWSAQARVYVHCMMAMDRRGIAS